MQGTGTLAGSGQIFTVNPNLGPLADNGGPSKTMRPIPPSPAIDAGVGLFAAVDQRGLPHPKDGNNDGNAINDIGAVEVPNVNLSGLVLSSGPLSPAFGASTTAYTATVPAATASVTLTPTAADALSTTITVNGTPVTSGAASGAIALSSGANTINTVVTEANGKIAQTYTVTVTRQAGAGDIFISTSSDTGAGSVRDVFDTVNDGLNTGPTYTTVYLDGRTSSSGATFNPYPLLRPKGGAVTIEGNGGTLNGGGASRPLFIYSGNVTLHNLTLANTRAFGGNGRDGAGGGAGLGGGIFVYKGASVIADHVTFSASSATGGNGGSDGGAANEYFSVGGGGGGMAGHGGGEWSPPHWRRLWGRWWWGRTGGKWW